MKRVLIIGSTSTVGLAIAQALATDAEVTLAGRRNGDFIVDLGQDVDFSSLDARYDTVVNVVAYFGQEMPTAVRVNALGALQTCILAKTVGAEHMVQISSISAGYDPNISLYDAYSLTKRQGEELCELFCATHSLPLTILRPTQLYDATGAARAHQGMFYHMLDQAATGRDITIFGQRDPSRNYMFMPDFVEVCRRVIETGATGKFTVAHPQANKLSEIAALAYQCFGTSGAIRFDDAKPDLDDITALMDPGLVEAIGYVPATSLVEGIGHFQQYQEHKH